MSQRVFISKDGEVLKVIDASREQLSANTADGDIYVDNSDTSICVEHKFYCFKQKRFKDLPPKPTIHHTYDYVSHEWVDPRGVDDLRVEALSKIKELFKIKESAGFYFEGNAYDSDQISQIRIQSIIVEDFINFKTKENSTVVLSKQDFSGLKLALSDHIQATHAEYNQVKVDIEKASSLQLLREFIDE